jgi:hypothetical protein
MVLKGTILWTTRRGGEQLSGIQTRFERGKSQTVADHVHNMVTFPTELTTVHGRLLWAIWPMRPNERAGPLHSIAIRIILD